MNNARSGRGGGRIHSNNLNYFHIPYHLPIIFETKIKQEPSFPKTTELTFLLSQNIDPLPTRPRHSSLQRHLPPHNKHPQSPQSPGIQREKNLPPSRHSPAPPLTLPTPRRNHDTEEKVPHEPLLRRPGLGEPEPRVGWPGSGDSQGENLARSSAGAVSPFQLCLS